MTGTTMCSYGWQLRINYLDGGEWWAKEAYRAHLRTCPACRQAIDESAARAKIAERPRLEA